MKEIREIILGLKNKDNLNKEQFWLKLRDVLEPTVEKELEKLMREGEIFFPKKDVITRIG